MIRDGGGGSTRTVDLRGLKEGLRRKLPPDSPILSDLLLEPDIMAVPMAEVLVPHYLRRLERELESRSEPGIPVLRR
ncbi:MAG TPA: hypothetical protein VGR56_04205 [Nitrososphaerales archaeon]|nr:hypothetical protein [Nitrososphaerales archaeon]